jgi:hypothetical protein
MAGYWAAGLWTAGVNRYFLTSLFGALLAIACGRAVNRRLDARRFQSYVYAGLIASGLGLLVQAIVSAGRGAP